jgi:hypothetical protein
MGIISFNLASDVIKTAANIGINGNGIYTVWTSQTQQNPTDLTSLRTIIDYKDTSPTYGENPITFEISALIESQNNGNWFPVAYQFEPFRTADQGKKRILLLQPDISTFDSGIDDIIYVGGETIARISRQQGKLGPSWRARIIVLENGYGSPGAFQSLTFNVYGEVF